MKYLLKNGLCLKFVICEYVYSLHNESEFPAMGKEVEGCYYVAIKRRTPKIFWNKEDITELFCKDAIRGSTRTGI